MEIGAYLRKLQLGTDFQTKRSHKHLSTFLESVNKITTAL